MKTKQLLLGAAFALATTISIAQPSEVTDAAMAYQSAQGAMMSQKFERYIEKILEAKKSITAGEAKEDGKTHPKTYQYVAQINMELMMAMAISKQANIENAELKAYEEKADDLQKEAVEAYKKCKALDTKKKRHIKELTSYMGGKLGMMDQSARTAFSMKMYDGAFGAFMMASGISKMIGSADSVTFDKNAIAALANYYDTLKTTNKYEESLPVMEAAYSGYPNNENVVEYYAVSLIKAGKKDKAKEVMAEAAKNNPKNSRLIYTIGIVYSENLPGDDTGLAVLKEGVKNNPDDYYLNYITAVSIYNQGTEVNEEIRKLDLNDPKEAELRDKKKKVFSEAVPYFEKCRESKPDSQFLIKSLFTCYRAAGMKEKAVEMKGLMK